MQKGWPNPRKRREQIQRILEARERRRFISLDDFFAVDGLGSNRGQELVSSLDISHLDEENPTENRSNWGLITVISMIHSDPKDLERHYSDILAARDAAHGKPFVLLRDFAGVGLSDANDPDRTADDLIDSSEEKARRGDRSDLNKMEQKVTDQLRNLKARAEAGEIAEGDLDPYEKFFQPFEQWAKDNNISIVLEDITYPLWKDFQWGSGRIRRAKRLANSRGFLWPGDRALFHRWMHEGYVRKAQKVRDRDRNVIAQASEFSKRGYAVALIMGVGHEGLVEALQSLGHEVTTGSDNVTEQELKAIPDVFARMNRDEVLPRAEENRLHLQDYALDWLTKKARQAGRRESVGVLGVQLGPIAFRWTEEECVQLAEAASVGRGLRCIEAWLASHPLTDSERQFFEMETPTPTAAPENDAFAMAAPVLGLVVWGSLGLIAGTSWLVWSYRTRWLPLLHSRIPWTMRLWGVLFHWIWERSVTVEGLENMPLDQSAVVVGNHCLRGLSATGVHAAFSWRDPVMLGTAVLVALVIGWAAKETLTLAQPSLRRAA